MVSFFKVGCSDEIKQAHGDDCQPPGHMLNGRSSRSGNKMEIAVTDSVKLEDATDNDELLRLYRYWLVRRGGRLFPSRSAVDPVEFSFALGRVSLIDVMEKPRRFRYRVMAATLVERLDYDLTNKYVDDISDDDIREYIQNLYAKAVDTRVPLYNKNKHLFLYQNWQHENLILPLSEDETNINMLISYRVNYRPEVVATPRTGRSVR